jgi:two-component system phosphate regulon sensor histidine kinase PhoR
VLWAFSFEVDDVQRELARRVVDVAGGIHPDLAVNLVRAREPQSGILARRTLAPELPRVAVVVRPADPAGLADKRSSNRRQRQLIIALTVATAVIGIFVATHSVNRELDAARQKADFAANVSHELRSPITQIRLKGESLQLDLAFDDEDRRAHYDAIVREAERLSRLVDNVLDFSSIERGVKRYTLRPDDLGDAVRRAVEATRSAADAAGLVFHVSVPETLPIVWIDREAIGQVMTNLLSNAVKYGAEGGSIEVLAREGRAGVEVSVTDHGIGIGPDDQDRVFEHFYRVASADVRKRRGTGIGLTIVRYIVEAHGGTITVESQLGRGSTFTVALPLAPPETEGV